MEKNSNIVHKKIFKPKCQNVKKVIQNITRNQNQVQNRVQSKLNKTFLIKVKLKDFALIMSQSLVKTVVSFNRFKAVENRKSSMTSNNYRSSVSVSLYIFWPSYSFRYMWLNTLTQYLYVCILKIWSPCFVVSLHSTSESDGFFREQNRTNFNCLLNSFGGIVFDRFHGTTWHVPVVQGNQKTQLGTTRLGFWTSLDLSLYFHGLCKFSCLGQWKRIWGSRKNPPDSLHHPASIELDMDAGFLRLPSFRRRHGPYFCTSHHDLRHWNHILQGRSHCWHSHRPLCSMGLICLRLMLYYLENKLIIIRTNIKWSWNLFLNKFTRYQNKDFTGQGCIQHCRFFLIYFE